MGAKDSNLERSPVRDDQATLDVFEISGSIKWFDPSKGYGFIVSSESEASRVEGGRAKVCQEVTGRSVDVGGVVLGVQSRPPRGRASFATSPLI
jgi:hypothetical protein